MAEKPIPGLAKLEQSVGVLAGVGPAKKEALAKLGVECVGDLVRLWPRAYQNRGDTKSLLEIADRLRNGETGPFSTVLTVSAEPQTRYIRRGMVITKVRAFDGTGSAEITWFNQPYVAQRIHTGETYRFFGRFAWEYNRVQINSPISEPWREDLPLPAIVPVYPVSQGLTQRFVSDAVLSALRYAGDELTETLPTDALEEMRLPSFGYTVRAIHRPADVSEMETARRRLVFEELYYMFLSMALTGAASRQASGPLKLADTDLSDFLAALPFSLTGAQARSVGEIVSDMAGENLMNRILTGDVGSGKTVVAAAAMYAAVKNGFRAVLMAPTEILANQHAEDLSKLFGTLGVKTALLTGSTKKKERAAILEGLRGGGEIKIVVGTHALLTEDVVIGDLGLAVIDEQHRFGVHQRAALFDKAKNVHCLVMSATPIPRTLTLAAYGMIDVSRIDELPAGRQKIDTFIVNETYRERLNGFIRKQAAEGHQTYVVCPAVEESEKGNDTDAEEMADLPLVDAIPEEGAPMKSAVQHADELAEALPELNVGFVHGKLKSSEKDRVMAEFAAGNLDVLVSTTVIEVGVNVPNATLMIVENAERFGLSQLHQLRGRVGRGTAKSYFILVSDSTKPEAQDRLRAVKSTTDGFEIAEYDLELRGPGDFFNETGAIRQHGQMNFRLAAACRDPHMIERASHYARRTAEEDPGMTKPANASAARRLASFTRRTEKTQN
ncbi:MAG: ATP-dependent DNA helicase RecG [Clostridia bacterium]|nr:ATP-dependent DNA helicase RecG [Clostridia bacterium]